MHTKRKRRLKTVIILLSGISLSVALLLTALGSNMNHYYELDAIAAGEAPLNTPIRIGGLVAKGSIKRTPQTLDIRFRITDLKKSLAVEYTGIVPDLFREGQGVLARGILVNQSLFQAQEILTKHDENYMPKEVQQELDKNGYQTKYNESP